MPAPELLRVGPDEWQTFRDVRLAQIYEGTNQIQRLIIAKQVERELA